MTFGFGEAGRAFHEARARFLMSPLNWWSIKGVRVDGSGAKEVIFEIRNASDFSSTTHDLIPSFPGSWNPPDEFRSVYQIPK